MVNAPPAPCGMLWDVVPLGAGREQVDLVGPRGEIFATRTGHDREALMADILAKVPKGVRSPDPWWPV